MIKVVGVSIRAEELLNIIIIGFRRLKSSSIRISYERMCDRHIHSSK